MVAKNLAIYSNSVRSYGRYDAKIVYIAAPPSELELILKVTHGLILLNMNLDFFINFIISILFLERRVAFLKTERKVRSNSFENRRGGLGSKCNGIMVLFNWRFICCKHREASRKFSGTSSAKCFRLSISPF